MLRETKSNVPLLKPITHLVSAGATETISFPDQYLGIAVSVKIKNRDSTNTCSYQINGTSSEINVLGTSSNDVIDDTEIKLLRITAGASGIVEVQAQVQLLVR